MATRNEKNSLFGNALLVQKKRNIWLHLWIKLWFLSFFSLEYVQLGSWFLKLFELELDGLKKNRNNTFLTNC